MFWIKQFGKQFATFKRKACYCIIQHVFAIIQYNKLLSETLNETQRIIELLSYCK